MRLARSCWKAILLMLTTAPAWGGEARIAVASNFTVVAQELAADFERRTGHRLKISFGSSGKIYTQIYNGAPFELFLSADSERPRLLESKGLALADSRFTYARGRIALWSSNTDDQVEQLPSRLLNREFHRLALANPKLAPYGAAARSYLNTLELNDVDLAAVYGENIAQTYQFVVTGNADLGFVALSQMKTMGREDYWLVPEQAHPPISQQAVLLKPGADSVAAKAFVEYLQDSDAKAIISRYGYGV